MENNQCKECNGLMDGRCLKQTLEDDTTGHKAGVKMQACIDKCGAENVFECMNNLIQSTSEHIRNEITYHQIEQI